MPSVAKPSVKICQCAFRALLGWLTFATFVFLASSAAHALEFQCELDGDVRFLRVDMPGKDHLCEVTVSYESTNEHKTMWYADNDSLYCSARAYELIGKYNNLWNFNCVQWPDRDGIDQLSPSHRAILDQQLKLLMVRGESSDTPFHVTGVKSVTSTLLDSQPGILALQYFLSDGTDRTQVIIDDKTSWRVLATINDLASHIDSDIPIDFALISAVDDAGSLEIVTTAGDDTSSSCHGQLVLQVTSGNQLNIRTPHRHVCNFGEIASASTD